MTVCERCVRTIRGRRRSGKRGKLAEHIVKCDLIKPSDLRIPIRVESVLLLGPVTRLPQVQVGDESIVHVAPFVFKHLLHFVGPYIKLQVVYIGTLRGQVTKR